MMRLLNWEVAGSSSSSRRREPDKVAREFLEPRGLIGG
jgi:hypothetical protein